MIVHALARILHIKLWKLLHAVRGRMGWFTMPPKDHQSWILAGALCLGAFGVALAFMKTVGGFDVILRVLKQILG